MAKKKESTKYSTIYVVAGPGYDSDVACAASESSMNEAEERAYDYDLQYATVRVKLQIPKVKHPDTPVITVKVDA